MSLSSVTSTNELLAQARVDWTRAAERKAAATGTRAESVPPDSVLIASDPTLSQEIQAADSSTTSSTSGGAPPKGGAPAGGPGASAKKTDLTISSSSQSASSSSIDEAGSKSAVTSAYSAMAASLSSTQNGRLVNVLM